jgi:hypothetical protein
MAAAPELRTRRVQPWRIRIFEKLGYHHDDVSATREFAGAPGDSDIRAVTPLGHGRDPHHLLSLLLSRKPSFYPGMDRASEERAGTSERAAPSCIWQSAGLRTLSQQVVFHRVYQAWTGLASEREKKDLRGQAGSQNGRGQIGGDTGISCTWPADRHR